jgi:hypothetical protein
MIMQNVNVGHGQSNQLLILSARQRFGNWVPFLPAIMSLLSDARAADTEFQKVPVMFVPIPQVKCRLE